MIINICLGFSSLSSVWNLFFPNTWYYIYSLIVQSYLTCYWLSLLFTMNRKIFKKSVCHFVFWFKILTSVQTVICHTIVDFWFIKQVPLTPIAIIEHMLRDIQLNLAIVMFSAIDCFPLCRKLKIVMGFALSLLFAVFAINFTFFMDPKIISMSTIHFSSMWTLSFGSLYASSVRVLFTFLCKQTILLFMKKNKAINIRYSPYVKWV